MDKKYNASDIEQELRAVSFYMKKDLEIPDTGYETIFSRLRESRLSDLKDEDFLSVLIFHALSIADENTLAMDSNTKEEVYHYSTVAAHRLLETGIIEDTYFPSMPPKTGILPLIEVDANA